MMYVIPTKYNNNKSINFTETTSDFIGKADTIKDV